MRSVYALLIILVYFIQIKSATSSPEAAFSREYKYTTQSKTVVEVQTCVREFYIWYKKNYTELNKIRLVPNSTKDRQYRVDFNAVNQYIDLLRSSGYLSKSLLQALREHFVLSDKKMVANRQTDGPPAGLEADIFLRTQEIDYSLSLIPHLKIKDIRIEGKKATAMAEVGYWNRISLVREGTKWHICEIGK